MIARDELAARCLVALLSNAGRVGHGSNVVDAVTCADALIARLASRPLAALSPALVPAATVPTPAYPVDDKGRPLWVRFVADHSNDKATPRRVLEWDGDVATVEGISPHRKPNGCKPSAKAGEWEPCAAPAETPAAALTEEDVESLKRDVRAALSAWRKDMADHRLADEVAITSVVAWFAKRGGAK